MFFPHHPLQSIPNPFSLLSHTHPLTVTLHHWALACVWAVAGPLQQCECQAMQKLREPRHNPLRSLLTLTQQLLQRHPSSFWWTSAQSQVNAAYTAPCQATSSITETHSASSRKKPEWGIFTLWFVETYSQFWHSCFLSLSLCVLAESSGPEERKKRDAWFARTFQHKSPSARIIIRTGQEQPSRQHTHTCTRSTNLKCFSHAT